MTYETLLVDVTDGVATVTLNRPEVRNALNRTMIAEIEAALEALERDPSAHVVVLRGAGEKAFCAGADLKGVGTGARRSRRGSPSAGSSASWKRWRG